MSEPMGENILPFKRVDLENDLRADADGMPVFRKCFDHEVLMNFYDDDGCYAFKEWWEKIGAVLFNRWSLVHDEWKHIHEWNKKYIKGTLNKMTKDNLRIHNHPIMERKLNVPEGHVIIDDDLYVELMRRFGNSLKLNIVLAQEPGQSKY